MPSLRVLHIEQVVIGDWFMPLGELKGRLSGILSNPPYIPSTNVPMLQVWGLSELLQELFETCAFLGIVCSVPLSIAG